MGFVVSTANGVVGKPMGGFGDRLVLVCPRCKGTGGIVETTVDGAERVPCSVCGATGCVS